MPEPFAPSLSKGFGQLSLNGSWYIKGPDLSPLNL